MCMKTQAVQSPPPAGRESTVVEYGGEATTCSGGDSAAPAARPELDTSAHSAEAQERMDALAASLAAHETRVAEQVARRVA